MTLRRFALLCVLALAGCTSASASEQPSPVDTAITSVAPTASPTVYPTIAPTIPPTHAPPSPTCAPADLANYSRQEPQLRWVEDPQNADTYGLTPSSQDLTNNLDWHQPEPRLAISTPAGARLLLDTSAEPGQLPYCIRSITVDAAPFSPIGARPEPGSLIRVASETAPDVDAGSYSFAAPTAAGDWVLRAFITWLTDGEERSQDSYFRVLVDAKLPDVGGAATVHGSCASPGDHPPRAYLSVGGDSSTLGGRGSLTWRGMAADSGELVGPRVDAARADRLVITTEDWVCAAWWQILLAPRPAFADDMQEPFLELVPGHGGYQLPAARANDYVLEELPTGDWVVEAFLDYAGRGGRLIGQTTNFWNVVVE